MAIRLATIEDMRALEVFSKGPRDENKQALAHAIYGIELTETDDTGIPKELLQEMRITDTIAMYIGVDLLREGKSLQRGQIIMTPESVIETPTPELISMLVGGGFQFNAIREMSKFERSPTPVDIGEIVSSLDAETHNEINQNVADAIRQNWHFPGRTHRYKARERTIIGHMDKMRYKNIGWLQNAYNATMHKKDDQLFVRINSKGEKTIVFKFLGESKETFDQVYFTVAHYEQKGGRYKIACSCSAKNRTGCKHRDLVREITPARLPRPQCSGAYGL